VKIAVCVYGPEFACTENLLKAFAKWGEVRLFSTLPSDWRGYDTGLLLNSKEARQEAKEYCNEADLIWLGDSISVVCLGQIGGPEWIKWAKCINAKIAGLWGDSTYFLYPNYIDGISTYLGLTTFVLPDLRPKSNIRAIPLHHPQIMLPGEKTPEISIMHSPCRDGKAVQKGTPAIEEIIVKLQADEELSFSYKRLTYLTFDECIALKKTCHIFIDQMPPEGKPRGLGRSGLEGLATGAVTLCDAYEPKEVDGYFDYPPIVIVKNQEQLEAELRDLLTNQERRERLQKESTDWVRDNIELDAWLKYVGSYL
jgi:hypothetical protein